MSNLMNGSDVLASTTYSDSDVTQWVLRVWHEATHSSLPASNLSHHNNPDILQRTAVQLFGDNASAFSSRNTNPSQPTFQIADTATLKRRYRQLVVRVHPDKNTSANAAAAFQIVQSCFEHAVSSGNAALLWTWTPASQSPPRHACAASVSTEAQKTEKDGNSVSSSLFSSSTSSTSRAPSPSHSAASFSSSSSSSPSTRCDRHAYGSRTQAYCGTNPSFTAHAAGYGRGGTAAAEVSNAAVPEPPTVLFDDDEVHLANKNGGPADTCGEFLATPSSPPPPPCVFGDEDEDDDEGSLDQGEKEKDQTEDAEYVCQNWKNGEDVRRAAQCKAHAGAKDGQHPQNEKLRSRAKARCRSSERTFPAYHRTVHLSHTPKSRKEPEAPFQSAVPPPPSVFDTPKVPSRHTSEHRHSETSRSKAESGVHLHHRQRHELPTLAELLARLDADDGADELLASEHIPEHVYAPLPSAGPVRRAPVRGVRSPYHYNPTFLDDPPSVLKGSSAHHHHTHIRREGQISGRQGYFDAKRTFKSNKLCGGLDYSDGDMQDDRSAPAMRFTGPTRAPFFAETGAKKMNEDQFLSFRSDVSDTLKRPTASVRSRRSGGGGGIAAGRLATTNGASTEERCGCGKARKGQCFLCE